MRALKSNMQKEYFTAKYGKRSVGSKDCSFLDLLELLLSEARAASNSAALAICHESKSAAWWKIATRHSYCGVKWPGGLKFWKIDFVTWFGAFQHSSAVACCLDQL